MDVAPPVDAHVILGARRGAMLRFIIEFHKSHGYAPSTREVRDAVGLASASNTNKQLVILKEAGYIDYVPKEHRTLTVTPTGRAAARTL